MSRAWSNSPKIRPENKCQQCGCNCDSCVDTNSIHLHQEIEDLKHRLNEKEHQIVTMESQILMHANQYPHGEMQALRESIFSWQDKYERLLESYRKLQKVNQGLEDKLLRIADKFENEKISLIQSVAELNDKAAGDQLTIAALQQENEQYKSDCNLAIRMLQCKPSQFVSQKLESFPSDVQERVQKYLNYRRPNGDSDRANGTANGGKLISVPIPTFPPTALVYSLDNKSNINETRSESNDSNNYVSAAIMAKILEERENERINGNKCGKDSFDSATQTGERNEFFIQMDGQTTTNGHDDWFSNGGNNSSSRSSSHAFHPKSLRSDDSFQLNSPQQTVYRSSKSNQNETIII